MKRLKWEKVLKVVFFILSCFWMVILVVNTVFRLTIKDNGTTGAESLDLFLIKALYNVSIIFSIIGVCSSVLGYISFAKTIGPAVTGKRILMLKNALYSFCIADNIVFYLSFWIIAATSRDIIMHFLMPTWLLLTLLSIVLFIVVKLQIQSSNRSDSI